MNEINQENLLTACISNDFDLVKKFIIDEEQNPNQRFEHGATALMIAAQEGNIKIVQLLLEKGADPNIHAENNVTPLMIAAKQGHIEIAKLLVSHGAKTSYDEQ